MNNMNKKMVLIALATIMVGLLIVGGTYAYFSVAMTVTNGNYVTNTHCFDVEHTNNTDQITGTLFPSSVPGGGLSGNILFKRSTSCSTNGRGTLYLHVDNGTSNILTSTVEPHCENKYTLETIKNRFIYDCTGENMKWVTDGTALKYAVYDSTERNHLYAAGYIDSSFIGQDKAIHSDFSVTNTQKTYYLYIWLDGNVSDDTYTDLPFSATSRLSVAQTKSTDTTFTGDVYTTISNSIYQYGSALLDQQFYDTYKAVEYIKSTGTQYLYTDLSIQANDEFETKSSTSVTGTYKTIIASKNVFELYYNSPKLTTWKNISVLSGPTSNLSLDEPYIHRTKVTADGNNLEIFSYNKTYNLNGKIYYVKWFRNDQLISYFVPVYQKTDGVAGLYDIVNDEFYTNSNTSGDDFELPDD